MGDSLNQFLNRLATYSFVEVFLELAIIWLVVYFIVRFLRDTGGAGIVKGLSLLLVIGTVFVLLVGHESERFQRLNYLYQRSLGLAAVALLIIFQPELRRALVRLGEATFFRTTRSEMAPVIEALVQACEFNSKARFGLLVAIVRNVGLGGIVEGGTRLNADVSAALLQSIFWPNSALHDLGVVIEGRKIVAASVQFPLTSKVDLDPRWGSRHRAAIGITEESDCLAVVVSEETGQVSVAERGILYRMEDGDDLRRFLVPRLLQDDSRRKAATTGVSAATASTGPITAATDGDAAADGAEREGRAPAAAPLAAAASGGPTQA